LAVQVTARLDEFWNNEAENWDDWREYEVEAEGYLWIIKKDGSENQNQIEALVRHTGWDASIPSIAGNQWQPTPCQFVIQGEAPNDFHTDVRYRINWINDYEQTPTAGNVDMDRATALQNQYGARLRALAGNVQRNAPTPEGKPPSPPKPVGAMTPEEMETEKEQDGKDGIPF